MNKILGILMLVVWFSYSITQIEWLLPILGMLIGWNSATLIFKN